MMNSSAYYNYVKIQVLLGKLGLEELNILASRSVITTEEKDELSQLVKTYS
ncbi:hypothetical protein [Bacillus sp. 1P06AnD]|uniref:hypothetical protein n=1 Tax=Bacillus sp. 1P06AnD TaxID=3132208 RepID=UPI0039A27DCE